MLLVALLLGAGLPAVRAQGASAAPARTDPNAILVLGNPLIAPVLFEANGQADGLAADILDAMALRMSEPVELQLMDWKAAQAAVAAGQADALIQISSSAERLKTFDFSEPLLESHLSIFVRSGDAGMDSLDRLAGHAVGVEAGGLPEQLVSENAPGATLVETPSFEEGFLMLASGRLDAVVADSRVGTYTLARKGLSGIVITGDDIQSSWSAFAVRKGNATLLQDLNAALGSVKSDGTYDRIVDGWAPVAAVFKTQGQIDAERMAALAILLGTLLAASALWALFAARQVRRARRAEADALETQRVGRVGLVSWPVQRGMEVRADWSPTMFELHGLSPTEPVPTLAEYLERFDPRPREPFAGALERLAIAGEPFRQEVQVTRADGDPAWLLMRGHVEPDAAGRPETIHVTVTDLTDLRRAERAEERISGQYQALFDSTAAGAIVTRRDGTVEAANQAARRILAPGGGDLVGTRASAHVSYVGPDGSPLAVEDLPSFRVLATGRPCPPSSLGIRRRDGSITWLTAAATPLETGPDGAVVRVLASFTDVTEMRAAQEREQLAAQAEMVGRLAGGVAHDFNNILGSIGGYAALVQHSLPANDPRQRELAEITVATQRASGLTRQLLAYGRRQVLEMGDIDGCDLVGSLEPLLRSLCSGTGVNLEISLDEGGCVFHGDRSIVENALVNLVINARDAMPHGGSLTLTCATVETSGHEPVVRPPAAVGRFVRLDVADTGTGIAPDVMPHILEPFYTTKEIGKGSGLGLASVDGGMQQIGGMLAITTVPGAGSTFSLYLPASTVRPQAVAGRTAGRPSPVETRATLVLAVDDDATIRLVAGTLLERLGYSVIVAGGPDEALALAVATRPDVVLSDVQMPGMSGPELLVRLREQHPGLPAVLMSAYAPGPVPAPADEASRTLMLQKPFTMENLARRLREALGR